MRSLWTSFTFSRLDHCQCRAGAIARYPSPRPAASRIGNVTNNPVLTCDLYSSMIMLGNQFCQWVHADVIERWVDQKFWWVSMSYNGTGLQFCLLRWFWAWSSTRVLKLLTWFDRMLICEFYYGFWIRSGYCHEYKPMWAKVRSWAKLISLTLGS